MVGRFCIDELGRNITKLSQFLKIPGSSDRSRCIMIKTSAENVPQDHTRKKFKKSVDNSVEFSRLFQFFEIEVNDNDQIKAEKKVNDMCKKLLVNLIIEDYKINKLT